MMPVITTKTNRVDLFAAAHGITEDEVVRWNLPYFESSATFWLPLGENFNSTPPRTGLATLLVNGRYLVTPDRRLVI